jgi:hypothetical protein
MQERSWSKKKAIDILQLYQSKKQERMNELTLPRHTFTVLSHQLLIYNKLPFFSQVCKFILQHVRHYVD